ncbi:MAG: SIS domain-containing protein [Candidatus Omnitrophota bacterium]
MQKQTKIKGILTTSSDLLRAVAEQANLIEASADAITAALKNGGKLLAFGNGGSAGDSQHMVAELVGRFSREKKPLPAIALNADPVILTALSNDYGYEFSFSKQIEALGMAGDVAFAISTSGNAKNVTHAVETAHQRGLITIGLTGKDGGALARVADRCLIVPSQNTARIQEAHIAIIHIICELIEEAFI